MRTTTPRLLTILAIVGTLALAGCTDTTTDEATTPETLTSTQTVATSTEDATPEAPAETVTTGDAGTEASSTSIDDAPGNDDPATDIPREDLPQEPVGSEITIAGEPATVCIYGDGWGTNVWAGNANTSCEFVVAVHESLIEGLNPTRDNIRQNLKEQVTVTSPVTGEDYDMTCAARGEALVTCTGGEGAAVHFY